MFATKRFLNKISQVHERFEINFCADCRNQKINLELLVPFKLCL